MQMTGKMVFLQARKFDFTNDNGDEVRGVNVWLLERDGDPEDKNNAGGLVTKYSMPIENWGTVSDLRTLSIVSATFAKVGTRLRLVKVEVEAEPDDFSDLDN